MVCRPRVHQTEVTPTTVPLITAGPSPRDQSASGPGQALVLLSLLLALLLVPLGLMVLAVRAQVDTYRQVQGVVATAAYDAAGMLDPHALLGGTLRVDQPAAQARADRTLSQGLAGYGQRVVAAGTALTVRTGSAPTVCYAATVTIGVLMSDGWGWTYHLSACARSAVPAG